MAVEAQDSKPLEARLNIAILTFHHVDELELISLYSHLHQQLDPERYAIFLLAKARNSVESERGVVITPHWGFMSVPTIDILIIPGGKGIDGYVKKDRVSKDYLKRLIPNLALTIALSEGVFLLGMLGFLRDLIATAPQGQQGRLADYEVGEVLTAGIAENANGIWCAQGEGISLNVVKRLHEYLNLK
ncbi:MAG: DJ-1/PfpI family protein [Deinococcales bacterium]